jgi:hypothetical protein
MVRKKEEVREYIWNRRRRGGGDREGRQGIGEERRGRGRWREGREAETVWGGMVVA